jgi:membrane dipeptidase
VAGLSTAAYAAGSPMTVIHRRTFLQGTAALLAACAARPRPTATPDTGDALYRRVIVIDGNLVPPLDDEHALPADVVAAVKASGLTAIKVTIGGSSGGYAETRADVDGFTKAIALAGGAYQRILRAGDLDVAKRSGAVGIIYSFEAVEMLEGSVERIEEFSGLGVRVMQLSYNKPSPFAAGVLAPQPSSGLTELGRQAVAKMNALGVTLDLSHADEASTLAALTAASKPAVISHAGCSAIHAHPRNKSDAVLRALAERGGTIGIYELSFLSAGPAQQSLDDYVAHVEHALRVCGEDHVGIGSDALLMPFDTTPGNMAMWDKDIAARKAAGIGAPEEGRPPYVVGLNRPDRARHLARALLARRHPERVVEKLLGANFQRVFAQTWPA